MWIEKRKNSKGTRYVYIERYTDPATGRTIKVSTTLNSNSKAAQKKAALILWNKYQDKTDGDSIPTPEEKAVGLSFKAVTAEWLEWIRPTVKPVTNAILASRVRKICSYLPLALPLVDFRPAYMETIARAMHYTEKLSYEYTSSVIRTIKSIMSYAKRQGYVDDIAPYMSYKIKRRPVTAKEMEARQNKFLDHNELREVLSQLRHINLRIASAMEFVALTGLRCGELLALRVQDYDAEKKEICVNGTIARVAGRPQRGTPKNVYSYRKVSLNSRADAIIRRFILETQTSHTVNGLCAL